MVGELCLLFHKRHVNMHASTVDYIGKVRRLGKLIGDQEDTEVYSVKSF